MPAIDRGTTSVLLVDFLAAMGVMTFGLLYAKVDPVYLVLLAAITFALFFMVWALLAKSSEPRVR
jgi:hypothetical protein